MSWPTAALGDLCQINIGRTPSRSVSAFWEGGDNPWLSISDMGRSKEIRTTKEGITQAAIDACNMRLVNPGTVLFSFKLSIGKVGIASVPLFTNEAIASLPVLDPGVLCEGFLIHALDTVSQKLVGDRAAMGMTLNKASLAEIQIPLPPLEEQRRIAGILDKVASIHKTAGQAEARIGQLEASVFDRYFCIDSSQCSWEAGPLSAFCDLITDGEHQTPERTPDGIKLLSARNIQNGKLDYGKVDYVPEHEFARISRRCAPRRGDILISCSGSIGRVAAYDSDEPVALVRSVALVRPKPDKLRPLFLELLLRTPRMQALMQRSANVSSQANLFQGPIKALQVFSPPLARQDAFADEVGRLRNINSSLDRRVASLRELTDSISDHLL